MHEKIEFPYPTPFEVIRFVLRALDLKYSNKALDERAYEKYYDQRELSFTIEESIYKPIAKYNQKAARQISSYLADGLDRYVNVVGTISADGITRSEMIPILVKSIITDELSNFYVQIHKEFSGPQPIFLFGVNASALSTIFEWLETNEKKWNDFLRSLEKGERDRISAWKRGESLPSATQIALLQNRSESSGIEWERIAILFLVGRAIDFLARDPKATELVQEVRVRLWGGRSSFNLETEIKKIQQQELMKVSSYHSSIAMLTEELKRTKVKINADLIMEEIISIREAMQVNSVLNATKYWFDWREARWWVFKGNLEKANEFYKLAVEDCLFRSGDNQKELIEEAVVVAAKLDAPDRVFLKHLKWSLINFKYDIPSINNKSPSNRFENAVEDWEVEMWAGSFEKIFPRKGWFPGVEYEASQHKSGPLYIDKDEPTKPDYRNPDRTIKIGKNWQKKIPQLIWFLMKEEYDVCKNLLEKGARINVSSEAGETPILMALGAMDATNADREILDRRFFDLISVYEHKPNVINQRTQKRRLLPIISAVETGKVEIVKRVLALGANPNGRGQTDEQTALNVCLKLIHTLKFPERILAIQMNSPVTPQVLDSIRRHGGGALGFRLTDQYPSRELNNLFQEYKAIEYERYINNIQKNMNTTEMRSIASLLIEAGADVNAEHQSPVQGYTPLMLAAESDEYELFEKMLKYNGDSNKSVVDHRNKQKYSCLEIARNYKSINILKILKELS